MAQIKKVLNSSVVLVADMDKDYIVLAKGIGYGRKKGEVIEVDHIQHQLFLPISNQKSKQILELLESIPLEVFEVTHEIIELASKELKVQFNDSLYFTLADHINFAIERLKENLVITNRLLWEIKSFYENEYNVGIKCLAILNKKFNVVFPEDEAVNLAFHFANAQYPENAKQDSARIAKLIGEITNMVIYSLNKPIDKKSIHYVRFVTHIRFFVDRFFTDKMINDNNGIYNTVYNQFKEEEIAKKIRLFLEKKYGKTIPDEELAFLTIHINRLNR